MLSSDWVTNPTLLDTAIIYGAILIPFLFLFTLLQGRLMYELPWRPLLAFAAVASVVGAAVAWFILAVLLGFR